MEGDLDECDGAVENGPWLASGSKCILNVCAGQVALKFLRQYQSVADDVREKLLKVRRLIVCGLFYCS